MSTRRQRLSCACMLLAFAAGGSGCGGSDEYLEVTFNYGTEFKADHNSELTATCRPESSNTYVGGDSAAGWFYLSFNGCRNPGTYALIDDALNGPGVTECSWNPSEGDSYWAAHFIPTASCTVTILEYGDYVEGFVSGTLVNYDAFNGYSLGEIPVSGHFKVKVKYE